MQMKWIQKEADGDSKKTAMRVTECSEKWSSTNRSRIPHALSAGPLSINNGRFETRTTAKCTIVCGMHDRLIGRSLRLNVRPIEIHVRSACPIAKTG